MNLRMRLEELCHLPGLVGGQIVGDDMDLFSARLVDDDIGQKGDELSGCMRRRGLAQHLSGLGIESCVERERSMPVVLKAMSFCASRGKRQHRIKPIEGLNRGFLINTKNSGMLRWV